MSDDVKLVVSSKTVTRAVNNLLKNDQLFISKVTSAVEKALQEATISDSFIKTRVEQYLKSADGQSLLRYHVDEKVREATKLFLEDRVKSYIKNNMLDTFRKITESK